MNKIEIICGIAAPLAQPNVDTDQLMPGRFLSRPRGEGFAEQLFHDLRFRPDGSKNPYFILNQEPFARSTILLGGLNFGCGSSRESAAWALVDYGFACVIASSFADIFQSNCDKNSLLAVLLPDNVLQELAALVHRNPDFQLEVDLRSERVRGPEGFEATFHMDPFRRQLLLEGVDEFDYTRSKLREIEAFEADYVGR
ncbi:3-isopropylmalate dehydratase small subunit [Rhodococcus sp. SRB_17]|uniref:3-isopropylmalate dehydratase small subunit n=1 Tax=Acidovorax sp. SRB_24 TaxID=1962700 RepID=UPI00145CA77D|nr:3-isopropylmalate dehydratase small subunit [Acidovorax sp. SRB_24]NMM78860.1 3-isopropylmalate dehydratase small subunit [Acidovorax sp. SRB_24]NMM92094.1 3-isopropylmalate dehydratase small subunit [Rhodococcus sp. SRB_17]